MLERAFLICTELIFRIRIVSSLFGIPKKMDSGFLRKETVYFKRVVCFMFLTNK